jgi:TolB-like protein
MSADSTEPRNPTPTVFLSYASGDRTAAQALRDALPAFGLEVWYDESDLTGGDAWDQKIRKQIRECDFFMPVISAQTDARTEGYFRREWRLAVERTLDMADDRTFLLPVVIDDTPQSGARVPEKFLSVQWSRLPGGRPTAAFEALCRRLASGQPPQAINREATRRARPASATAARELPEFPKHEPGQRARFWLKTAAWVARSAWILFLRLPRWVRIVAYVWLAFILLSKGCSTSRHQKISSGDTQKLKEISDNYQGSLNKADVAKLAVQIAQNFSNAANDNPSARNPWLAIPFAAQAGDTTAQKLADASFAEVYGRVAISHRGHVSLANGPLPSVDAKTAAAQGQAQHATYVLYGAIDNHSVTPSLRVSIVLVEDGSSLWSKAYPVAGADPAQIAGEVDSKVSSLEND